MIGSSPPTSEPQTPHKLPSNFSIDLRTHCKVPPPPSVPPAAPQVPPRITSSSNPPTTSSTRQRGMGTSSATSPGPQVPPRTIKSFPEPELAVPPPRPPKSALTQPQPPPIPSRDSSHLLMDENIARLMDLGYSFQDVNRALVVANNDYSIAMQILSNFVRSVT